MALISKTSTFLNIFISLLSFKFGDSSIVDAIYGPNDIKPINSSLIVTSNK